MRKFINIVEGHSEELVNALHDWMITFSNDDAHTNKADEQCARIIKLSRDYPPTYRGILYRGTAIRDEHAQALLRGETVTIPPLPKKLVSWSKQRHNAETFAENAVWDNHSAVLIRLDSSRLSLVVDLDILYDARPDTGHESEILVHQQPLTISRKDIVSLWLYDPVEEDSIQVI